MNTKAITPLLIIGLILGMSVILGTGYIYRDSIPIIKDLNIVQQEIVDFSTDTCVDIDNPNDPTGNIYTEQLASSVFTCGEGTFPQASECIVSGWMMIDKASNSPVIIFRGTSNYYQTGASVAFTIPTATQMKSYILYDQIGSAVCNEFASTFLYSVSNPIAQIHWINNELVICQDGKARKYKLGGNADISSQLKTGEICNSGKVRCDQEQKFDAKFNFDPAGQTFFPEGSEGINNYQTGNSGAEYSTTEYRLNKGQRVTFDAKYGDGTTILNDINKKQIRVRSCDNTCANNIISGVSCNIDSSKVLCLSEGNTCPAGYSLITSGQYGCDTSPESNIAGYTKFTKSLIENTDLPICRQDGYSRYSGSADCYKPTNLGSQYKKCSDIQDTNGCYTWSTTFDTATGGLKCFVNNIPGAGVGELKCEVNQCALGDKQPYVDTPETNDFQTCKVNQEGCTYWGSQEICTTGLTFNSGTDKCVCIPSDKIIGTRECIDNRNLKIYEPQEIGSLTCTVSRLETIPASSERRCVDNAFTCEYPGGNKCTAGQKLCGSNINSYQECILASGETCNNYGPTQSTPSGYICQDNKLIPNPNEGCAFGTAGMACNTQLGLICGKDLGLANNNNKYNQCICNSQLYTLANYSDYQSSNTQCSNNVKQKVERIGGVNPQGGEVNSCYQWVNELTCGVDEICREFEQLTEPVQSVASCVSKFENVAIITKDAYKIKEKIDGIKIEVTGSVDLNIVYRAQLYLNNINGTRKALVSDGKMSQGKATINFDYTPLTTQKLLINLEACGDSTYDKVIDCLNTPDYINERKEIEVKKSFDLKLFCPITNYINEVVKCTWEPTDAETNNIMSTGVATVSVVQGNETLISPVVGNSLTFTPTAIGSVTVNVEASAVGYIKEVEQLIVEVTATGSTSNFKIDNTPYASLTSTGIDTGSRSLSFTVKEGNRDADVNSIRAEIVTPSGTITPVIFNKAGSSYNANYNFETPGQKYILRGEIIFTDINKQSIPFNYDILTINALSEKEKTNTTNIIIGVSIGVLVLIIAVVMFFVLRKKKR